MQNLYYFGTTTERVKIIEVVSCGVTKVRNKIGEIFYCHIGDLKKVY